MPEFIGGGSSHGNTPPPTPRTNLVVTDGTHTITNAATIHFGAGGSVVDGGNGLANVLTPGTGGGGGGTLAGGLGISLDAITNPGTTTINNTGTILQPNAPMGGIGKGVHLVSAEFTTIVGGANFSLGSAYYGGSGHYSQGGVAALTGGYAYNTSLTAYGALGGALTLGGGFARSTNTTSVAGAGLIQMDGGFMYGTGAGAKGGNVTLEGGSVLHSGTPFGTGGNVVVNPGTGTSNGVLLVHNIGTGDPHILDAKFQTSVAGVGFVGVYSKG